MSSADEDAKRPYDARKRRQRAEQERRATRNRVIDAATRLFEANGYRGTTMADIAREAGVAMQSVYAAGRSKADLLDAAVQHAVAGDDQEVLVHERPAFASVASEPDPVRRVGIIAELICQIQERSEPMQVAQREAAASDPALAASLDTAHRLRLETFRAIIGLLPADRLRSTPEASADTIWAVASAEVFQLLRRVRGWSWEEIRSWLSRLLVDVLLVPQPSDVGKP
jgi:AcrR family transcriptional regulator